VRYAIGERLDLRIDLRHLLVPDRTAGGVTHDFEASAGIAYRIGGTRPPRKAIPPPPPRPGDADHDTLNDDVDQCRELPEDFDRFEDRDGCPDTDNDRDGFADLADTCPNEPEIVNGWRDEDGCPDEVIAELTGIQFERDSARIDAASTALLERAYEILSKNTKLRVEISGHTSSEGDVDRNLDLSLLRAEAVKQYLLRRGIADARVQTVGHGSDKPVANNRTERGREQNRRIEFRILRGTDGL
jgi:outer membrane protein OmpA-like peptidoglycan-associated protein